MISYKVLILACVLISIMAGNCGGNCPAGNCDSCDCGTQKNFTDLNEACGGIAWDDNCCKCIIMRRSYGNTNFMEAKNCVVYKAGLAGLTYDECHEEVADRCYASLTKNCMYNLWSEYENWDRFGKDAKACGCSDGQYIEPEPETQ